MKKLSVDQLDAQGKRVFVRVDFNVPLTEELTIRDDARIQAALPTIKHLVEAGAKVVLASHCGRPKGERNPKMSLKPAAVRLGELLDKDVKLAPDCVGAEVEALVAEMKDGDVVLLENLRFHKEETGNDPAFSQQLAKLADLYVNDAFGTAHRAHASTEGVTKYIDTCAAGFLIKKELDFLGEKLFTNPQRPLVAILGGAKVSGKIEVIENLLGHVDTILIGGGMTFTFLKAQGLEIGKSLFDEETFDVAKSLLKKFEASSTKVLLPVDAVVADQFSADANAKTVSNENIPADWLGMDIGPETIKLFSDVIATAKTVVWNGPHGVFEMEKFAMGTKALVEACAETEADTIIGGGDTAAAVKAYGLVDKMSHVSTGGGASLEFMEGKTLPGVAALDDA